MIVIKTNLNEVVEQARAFIKRREAEVKKIASETPRRVGQIIKTEIISVIREQNLIASGDLLKSVSVTGLRASSKMYEATVGSSSPYAKFVEEGARPSGKMPPRDAIYKWMIQKGLEPSEHGAYLIARKIAETGLPARKPFETGIERARPKINREIDFIVDSTLKKD